MKEHWFAALPPLEAKNMKEMVELWGRRCVEDHKIMFVDVKKADVCGMR